MGEPDSKEIDPMAKVALAALGPSGRVPVQILLDTKLHREIVRQHVEGLEDEIKNLVGWRPLSDYGYPTSWYDSTLADERQGKELNVKWQAALEADSLSEEKAILLFDGETMRAPTPDYRLYILRDGRWLFYNGGFHGRSPREIVCDDALTVLDYLDNNYRWSTYSGVATASFIIMLSALHKVLGYAISDRKEKIDAQRALQKNLQRAIDQVVAK